jgi:hypothetical protein
LIHHHYTATFTTTFSSSSTTTTTTFTTKFTCSSPPLSLVQHHLHHHHTLFLFCLPQQSSQWDQSTFSNKVPAQLVLLLLLIKHVSGVYGAQAALCLCLQGTMAQSD